jgi:acyl-CoA dehydrogenase
MNFDIPPDIAALRERTRQFIAEQVIPLEGDPRHGPHGPSEDLRRELVARARAAGLLTPHASKEMGGLGLGHIAKAVVFEEAGYSNLGPTALNIHAPDEGNIHLMEEVATPAQKERWLRPQAAGLTRSCFAMTEPDPGAGADPSMLKTTAVRDGDDYVINGRKWFITGADGADYVIVMARMEDGTATMFLADMDQPGIHHERSMDTLDNCFTGGHGVLRFDNLRVPASDVLGEVGQGFRYAQIRLAPARLTHCMRWLGQARRAHDIALDYASRWPSTKAWASCWPTTTSTCTPPACTSGTPPGCSTKAKKAALNRAAPKWPAQKPNGGWWTVAYKFWVARASQPTPP